MKLVIRGGPDQGRTFDLAAGNNYIGRSEENTVMLPSGQVSRRHACIVLEAGRLFLEDQGSSNGTFVGGQRIQGRVEIRPGLAFQVGEFFLEVEPEGGGPRRPSGPVPFNPAMAGRPRPDAANLGGPIMPLDTGMRGHETPFWKFYRYIHFLGWRGQVILIAFFTALAIVGMGIYPVLLRSQDAMLREVLRRGEVLVKTLEMRNGEFIKNRQETNLDTSSFLSEPGVAGAYLLSKDLTILSPVEQRGKPKVNALSREALIKGDRVVMEETEVEKEGQAGIYHIAMPIKVWSNDRGIYESFGVAYIVYQARQVAEASAGTDANFITATVVIAVALLILVVLVFLLTSRPMVALHEDAELAMRGDLRTVESRARWKELVNLSHSLNRSFDRYQQALQSQPSASVTEMAGPSFQAASQQGGGGASDESKIEAIANAVSEGVIITDDMQRVVYLNRIAEKLFGVSLNRARSRHIMEIIGNQEILGAILDLLKQLIYAEDKTVSVSIPISDGGVNRKVNVVVAGVKGAGNQLEYAAIVIR